MEQSTTPAQRLGIELIDPQRAIRRFEKYTRLQQFDDPASHPDNTGRLSAIDLARFASNDAELVTRLMYLQGNWTEFARWSRATCDAIIYYLMGPWRDKQPHDDGTIDSDAWFQSKEPATPWVTRLNEGLGWAAVANQWNEIDELLSFPTENVRADANGRAIRNYYVGLARWWKNEQELSWIDVVKETRGAGSKGPHLLCDAVTAIAQRDAKTTAAALKKYVQWFLKGRAHQEQFPLNATFLWHVARRKGVALELPDDIDLFLFRLPESA